MTDHQKLSTYLNYSPRNSAWRTLAFLSLLFATGSGLMAQNTTCSNADPFCSTAPIVYPADVCPVPGTCNGSMIPCYDCLFTTPNPRWFYVQVGTSGTIVIHIIEIPDVDIDYVCWGPYASATGACLNGLTCDKVVSCSYDTACYETCTIPNAVAGEFYMLVVTNYSNDPTTVTLQQTNYGQPGSGATINCSGNTPCSILSITPNPSTCNPVTATYSVTGSIVFINPPSTGTLKVTDITAMPQVSQTFFPPFASPVPFTLSNIPCDGLVHNVTAAFSDSTACTQTEQYTAPGAFCPDAVISGGGNICADGSTATVNIAFTQGLPPFNFTWAVNGVPQLPVTNYSGPFPYVITTSAGGVYTMVSVSNNVCQAGTFSGSATIFVNSLPVPTVTPAFGCTGGPGMDYSTESGGSDYQWIVSAGGTVTAGGTINDDYVTVVWNVPGAQSISISYTDGYGCTAAAPTLLNINVNTSTPASLTLCNDPVTLTTAQPFLLRGGSPLGGNYWGAGANGGFFYPNVAGPGFDTIFYTYTNAPGCPSTASTVIYVVSPVPFICGNTVTDVRDSRVYPTIMIGNQCWMAANLDYGSQIMASMDQRDNCMVEKYCFNDIPALCDLNGGLYQWDELMQFGASPGAQGLCPPDWHVPAEADWNALFNMYGNNAFAGSALKDKGPSGFNALLNGTRFNNMIWSFEGFATILWSSTPIGEFKAWSQGMNIYNPSVSYYPSMRDNAFPVRCIKD